MSLPRISFDELPYYVALYSVYRRYPDRATDRVIIERPLTLYVDFIEEVVKGSGWDGEPIPWSLKRTLAAWMKIRKRPTLQTTCFIAPQFGYRCFYADRHTSLSCSSIVHLDRIMPGSQRGEHKAQNCILACSIHNQSRGDRSIQQYLEDEWMKRGELEYEARMAQSEPAVIELPNRADEVMDALREAFPG